MTLPDWLQAWLSSDYLPWLLFAGALGDALIGLSFVIPGELFFIAGGASPLLLLIMLWLGAWSGDLLSYAIGRRFGPDLLNARLMRSAKISTQADRGQRLLQQHGCKALILARLSGPLSWIMPALAGWSQLTFHRMALASLAGVLIGSAQFVAIGYAMGAGVEWWPALDPLWREYGYTAIAVCFIAAICAWRTWQLFKHGRHLRALVVCITVALGGFGLMNIGYFFASQAHARQPQHPTRVLSPSVIAQFDYQVYAGDQWLHPPQPVNLMLITKQSLSDLQAAKPTAKLSQQALGPEVLFGSQASDYFSDGQVVVIRV